MSCPHQTGAEIAGGGCSVPLPSPCLLPPAAANAGCGQVEAALMELQPAW